jgi:hypothetical protein
MVVLCAGSARCNRPITCQVDVCSHTWSWSPETHGLNPAMRHAVSPTMGHSKAWVMAWAGEPSLARTNTVPCPRVLFGCQLRRVPPRCKASCEYWLQGHMPRLPGRLLLY